jgi:hypothetical protein
VTCFIAGIGCWNFRLGGFFLGLTDSVIFSLFDMAVKIFDALELVMTRLSLKTICDAGGCEERE